MNKIDFSCCEIAALNAYSHWVGGKANDGELRCSLSPIDLEMPGVLRMLLGLCIEPFNKDMPFFRIEEGAILLSNISDIFHARKIDAEGSAALALMLHEASTHPNIRGGYVYVIYFKSMMYEDTICDAVGIFKSDSQEAFLQPEQLSHLTCAFGLSTKSLDKGCLILDIEGHDGYRMLIHEKHSRYEADYWTRDFLKAQQVEDSYMHTRTAMGIAAGFIRDVFNASHSVDGAAQAAVSNRALRFFSTHESCTDEEFMEEVLQEAAVIDAFKEYREEIAVNAGESSPPIPPSEFEINYGAAKKAGKMFNTKVRLDKNFELKINTDSTDLIERGYDDERGMNYYKVFFAEER